MFVDERDELEFLVRLESVLDRELSMQSIIILSTQKRFLTLTCKESENLSPPVRF